MDINKIYCGDNLTIMQDIPDGSIDLIYADPPYNTGRDFGEFDDRFENIDHYLEFIVSRLKEMHRILKPTGSIYLHCDWHASHHIRFALDKIFGSSNFRDEIIWCYRGGGAPQYTFRKKHDNIYRYTKSDEWCFNMQYRPYVEFDIIYRSVESKNKDRGAIMDDWWDDIPSRSTATMAKEWLDYNTQKPEALLDRIIKASTNLDDIVLDPFAGSGTTCAVAKKLGRQYIGIDNNPDAVKLTEERLKKIASYRRLNKWQ